MTSVRPAAVAGVFYPRRADVLERDVREMLAAAPAPTGTPPAALVAPHAGYMYSGPVAAMAYRLLEPLRGTVERVVVIGPAHFHPLRGIATHGAESFETPLGRIPLDPVARDLPGVTVLDAAHAREHSLEVHLPFLQVVLGEFRLVPLVVGQATHDEVAAVLDALWTGPETLVVASSDLSHFHDYDSARALDTETAAAIVARDPDRLGPGTACGRLAVGGLLTVARGRGLAVRLLDLRNSGDTSGDRDRVVGYGAFAVGAAD